MTAARIAINKVHFPVTVLGPGRRIGIWVQGCTIGCKGCISRDTWARDPQREMAVDDLLAWCRSASADGFDGVTVSGGEPFEQPEALAELLHGLARWRAKAALDFDILCYSGLALARLRKHHAPILELLDAVIAGPYVAARPSAHPWWGSTNQTLVPLSERGAARYGAATLAQARAGGKRMQMLADGPKMWFVGVPAAGDMQRLEALCRERGVDFAQVSWRS